MKTTHPQNREQFYSEDHFEKNISNNNSKIRNLQANSSPNFLAKQKKKLSNLFKNSLKQELRKPNFCSSAIACNQKQNQLTPIKLSPILLINKIQESRPNFASSSVFKELSFDALLQTSKPYRFKNCVIPTRPNSEVYKRLSKNFFQNIKNGIDQCLLFTGAEPIARVQSSIGNQSNPGIFMIVAIAILDQKYKENHERFDAQFSFLQYRGQKIYDLINYTEMPLEPKLNPSNSCFSSSSIQFCEHRVKVCTFLQFIKLLKIALFNNKQRDIKTNKQILNKNNISCQQSTYASSFIMKIKIKKYNLENSLIFQQQTTLIDFDQNCSFRSNPQQKDKVIQQKDKALQQNIKDSHEISDKSSENSNRSLMDYILIEINNSNPSNKPIHYHMVEKNLLLQILKKHIKQKQFSTTQVTNKTFQKPSSNSYSPKQQVRQYYVGGCTFIINSLTSNPYNYSSNIKFYQNLISSLGCQWQANIKIKTTSNKSFDLLLSENIFYQIINSIQNRKYSSLRDFYSVKQFYSKQFIKIISDIKIKKSMIIQYLKIKKNLIYNQNLLTAYQLQMIGDCVKSDNFKEFYTSKSYLALSRQIQIKTAKIKSQIISNLQNLKQIENKFYVFKKKETQQNKLSNDIPLCIKLPERLQKKILIKTFNPYSADELRSSKSKFSILDNIESNSDFRTYDDFDCFNSLKKYIYQYIYEIWCRVYLTQQRTVAEQHIFQDIFDNQTRVLKQKISQFLKIVQEINDVDIKALDEDKFTDLSNLTQLMRSINQTKKSILKQKNTQSGFHPFYSAQITKKLNLFEPIPPNLPKIKKALFKQKQKSISIALKQNKKQNQNKKVQVFEIQGKVDFKMLLLNPKHYA